MFRRQYQRTITGEVGKLVPIPLLRPTRIWYVAAGSTVTPVTQHRNFLPRFGNQEEDIRYVRFVSFSTARHAGSFLCFRQRLRNRKTNICNFQKMSDISVCVRSCSYLHYRKLPLISPPPPPK